MRLMRGTAKRPIERDSIQVIMDDVDDQHGDESNDSGGIRFRKKVRAWWLVVQSWWASNWPKIKGTSIAFVGACGIAIRNTFRKGVRGIGPKLKATNARLQARAERMAVKREQKQQQKAERKREAKAKLSSYDENRWVGRYQDDPDAAFVLAQTYDRPTRIWCTIAGLLVSATIWWFALMNPVHGPVMRSPKWSWQLPAIVVSLVSPLSWIVGGIISRRGKSVILWLLISIAIIVINMMCHEWVIGRAPVG